MDSLVVSLCPGSKFAIVASVDSIGEDGIYQCSGISPKQSFSLACKAHLCLGVYTMYDVTKLSFDAPTNCEVDHDTQLNFHEPFGASKGFTLVDLCSGLGGFALGSHRAGLPTGLFVERNPLACKALSDNFHVPIIQGDIEDIQTIKQAHRLRPAGRIQVVAGFPCQPYSLQGDGQGLKDSRGGTLFAILRGAWLLGAEALLLECVANVVHFADTQNLLDRCADEMQMRCERMVFDLGDQWPMSRKRFWCLMTPSTWPSDGKILVPWQKTSLFTTLGSIMPLDAIWSDEQGLTWDEDEMLLYGDPQFGSDQRILGPFDKANTVLHSWGNVLRPCPCQCRGALSMQRLREGGARGFGLISASTGHPRHFHPAEAKLLCTVPQDFVFDMDDRAALCLLGQLAAPLQVLWIQIQFLQRIPNDGQVPTSFDPFNVILDYQRDLLRQVQACWVTSTMYIPRQLHVTMEDFVYEIQVTSPVRAGELLQAEKKLQGWGQYAVLWQDGHRVPQDHLLHDCVLYSLEVRGVKQPRPFPVEMDAVLVGTGLTKKISGLGDKMIWSVIQTLMDRVQGHDKFLVIYPFSSAHFLWRHHPEQVFQNWRDRYDVTEGQAVLVFEHRGHWAVLAAKPGLFHADALIWTFFDGLREHSHLQEMSSVGQQIAEKFSDILGCSMACFDDGTVLSQHHDCTCGTIALAHVAHVLNHESFNQDRELETHLELLRFQTDEQLCVARGPDDPLQELAMLLNDKGVPRDQAMGRAQQVLTKLGDTQVKQILQSKNPWAQLKSAANKPGTMFRLVTADELAKYVASRAKTQHGADVRNYKNKKRTPAKPHMDSLIVDPSKLTLESTYFQDESEDAISQIPFADVEADQRGVALCTTSQARHFLENPKSISTDALAILLVDHPPEQIVKAAGLQKIMFPAYCPGTEEHMVLLGYILQLGDGKVSRCKVGSSSKPEVVNTGVIKFQVYKDEFNGNWAQFTQSPIKTLVQMMDSLQLCRGKNCGADCLKFHAAIEEQVDGVIFEVWARSYYDEKGAKAQPTQATCFTTFLRTPASAIRAILEGTPQGVYAEPRGELPRQHDQKYRVVWLPGDTFAEASHKCKTCAKSICLVRMRNKYGVRVLKGDEESVWTQLRPGLSYVDLEIAHIYELFPVPHGTQRQSVAQLLKDWKWIAKPLQPGRGNFNYMSWRVGAAGPPPHMVMQGFDLEVIITQVKDLTPQKIVPKVIASQKTQKHLSNTQMSSTAATSSSDPWHGSGGDPWQKFTPTTANPGKTRLAAIQDELTTHVAAKVRKELETHAQMEVDSDKSSNDQHEARFQALEVSMEELKQQNSNFMNWFQEAGERMQGTEKAVLEVQHTLGQHHTEIQNMGGIFKNSVQALKDDLTSEMGSTLSQHMQKLEALIEKRARHESSDESGRSASVQCGCTASYWLYLGRALEWSINHRGLPLRSLELPWPPEHWSSARVLVSRHWVNETPVIWGFYGYSQGPTWPQSRKLSDALLQTLTQEVVIGMHGVRIIQGDFNYDPDELLQHRVWKQYGWVEAQHLASTTLGHEVQKTCKFTTQRDQIWLSPEAASLLRGIEVFGLFADHRGVAIQLAIPTCPGHLQAWPRPAKLPWSEIPCDDWDPPCPIQFTTGMDSTQFFGDWAAAYETACADQYRSHTGNTLPAQCRGRAQRLQPQSQQVFTPTTRPSREGEVCLKNDMVGFATRRWFKQLRRLQSMKHSVLAENFSPSAIAYRSELWTAIVRAKGFTPTFQQWWEDREIIVDGSPRHLPQGPPAVGAVAVSALQSGAFISNAEHAKYDKQKSPDCQLCDCPDDRAHWLRCPRFASIRQQIEDWPMDVDQLPACALHHLLVPRLEIAVQWRQALHLLEDGTTKFCLLKPSQVMHHLFVDGSCSCPKHEPLKLAAWLVISATTGRILSMAPLSGIMQTISRAELSAVLAALRWTSYHQCDVCIWSDSRSTVRVLNRLRHLTYVPDTLRNRDLWLAVWEELQQCAALQVWFRWIPSHMSKSSAEDPYEDWIITWNGYADTAANEANQDRPAAFWELFRTYELQLDWWTDRLRKLRRFYELVADQPPSASSLAAEVIDIASDSEDEMVMQPTMLEDHLPVNWQLLCRQQTAQVPMDFVIQLLTWWCDVEILGSRFRVLSEVEFVFALISDPAYQFPFRLDGRTTWDFRTLEELFQKPTLAQLMHTVKLALRSIESIFPHFAFRHAPRSEPCIGIFRPFSGIGIWMCCNQFAHMRQSVIQFTQTRPIRRTSDLARPAV
eukprot:Skav202342  [mRNA]  locus=scaffold2638:36667:46016:- [translate_table: standard]